MAERGNEAGAMAWYEKAAAADPGFPHVYRRIGDLYFQRGDYARARVKLDAAIAKDPNNPYILANLELLDRSARPR